MNKKLKRALNPSAGLYFFVLLAIGVATAIMAQYVLSGVGLAVTLVLFVMYIFFRLKRKSLRVC